MTVIDEANSKPWSKVEIDGLLDNFYSDNPDVNYYVRPSTHHQVNVEAVALAMRMRRDENKDLKDMAFLMSVVEKLRKK